MILLERELLGYPGATITIEYGRIPDSPVFVRIFDPQGTHVWEPGDGATALAMFNHPFAYGYVYPEIQEGE